MTYYVENWYTEEIICRFSTEEARKKWLDKYTHREDTTSQEEGFPFWKRVLNEKPEIRIAIYDN